MTSTWLSLFLGVAKENILPALWRPHGFSLSPFPKGRERWEEKDEAHWLPPFITAANWTVCLCAKYAEALLE